MAHYKPLQPDEALLGQFKSPGFREAVIRTYDLANVLRESGLARTSLSVTHLGMDKTQGMTRDHFHIRLKVKPYCDFIIECGKKDERAPILYDMHDGGRAVHMNSAPYPEALAIKIARRVSDRIAKTYGDENTPDSRRPKRQFIRLDNDPYGFISALSAQVRQQTGGFEINVVDAADLPPRRSLIEQIKGFLLPLRPQPPLALPAPPDADVFTVPENIRTLPNTFRTATNTINDTDLRKAAQIAQSAIDTACQQLEEAYLKAGKHPDPLERVVCRNAQRPLRTDLTIIGQGLSEFDFARTTPETLRYLEMIEQTLSGHFRQQVALTRQSEEIGQSVALGRLAERAARYAEHTPSGELG